MSWVSVLIIVHGGGTNGILHLVKIQSASALRTYRHSTLSQPFAPIGSNPPSFLPLAELILRLHAVRELAVLLLVVVRRETARGKQAQRHRRAGTSLDDAGDGRGGEEDAAAQRELGAVVLVVLEEVAWEKK